jgi:hypothetical protein
MDRLEVQFLKLEFAKLSFQECSEYLDLYESCVSLLSENDSFVFERAISKCFIITYARPFTKNNPVNGHGVGKFSQKWTKTLQHNQVKLHNNLVGDGRNALVAHIDIDKLKPNLWIKPGEHNDYVIDWPILMINKNNIPDLRKLLSVARSSCLEQQELLKEKLGNKHIIPTVWQ